MEDLQPGRFLFASESVTEGHPDKLCDRIADAVLDACLAQDPEVRVSCEACTKSGVVMILGELVTKACVNYELVVREAVKAVGYDSDDKGLDWRTMNVINAIDEQSPDLMHTMTAGKSPEDLSIAEPTVTFGYASNETPELMPLSHLLAAKLCAQLDKVRKGGSLPWARPDGRAQVTVEYSEESDGSMRPIRLRGVVLWTGGYLTDVKSEEVEKELMEQVVRPSLPPELCDGRTRYHLAGQPRGAAGTRGGTTGLSGRKVGQDTYGGWGPGPQSAPLSGQDGSRLARSATYGARWAARSLVAAGLCKRCSVQLAYSPGAAHPTSISVNSYGTARACDKTDAELTTIIQQNFDFRPGCLQRDLRLKAPQFQKLSAYGHLGRAELELAWEKSKELH